MKSLLPLISASVLITGISLQALAETDTFTVEGMHCSSCKKIITQKVCNDSTLKTQFESCKVELTDHKKQIGQITITTKKDVKVDAAQIEKAVKAAGDEYKIINTQVK